MLDAAVPAAAADAVGRVLESPAIVVLTEVQLTLQQRHPVGFLPKGIALGGRDVHGLSKGVELSLKVGDLAPAVILRRA